MSDWLELVQQVKEACSREDVPEEVKGLLIEVCSTGLEGEAYRLDTRGSYDDYTIYSALKSDFRAWQGLPTGPRLVTPSAPVDQEFATWTW